MQTSRDTNELSETQILNWEEIEPVSSQEGLPSPRTGFSMEQINGQIVIFGGSNNDSVLGDFWIYEISKNIWKKAEPTKKISERSGSKSFVFEDRMYIYGGYTQRGGDYYNELFYFDPKSLETEYIKK